jgi:translocation and assembly module TamB
VEIKTEGSTTQDTALVIGKYLSPRLYLSYGVGLFDAANSLRLRYQLSRIWVLETESGIEQGADLLYTLERE